MPAPAPPATILFVEDEEAILRIGQRVLEHGGYTVLAAATAAEAFDRSARHAGAIDLLVIDLTLPDLGGSHVAARLTAERPGLRVLYVSGYDPEDVDGRDANSGPVRFLQKPFRPSSFLTAVEDALAG